MLSPATPRKNVSQPYDHLPPPSSGLNRTSEPIEFSVLNKKCGLIWTAAGASSRASRNKGASALPAFCSNLDRVPDLQRNAHHHRREPCIDRQSATIQLCVSECKEAMWDYNLVVVSPCVPHLHHHNQHQQQESGRSKPRPPQVCVAPSDKILRSMKGERTDHTSSGSTSVAGP